MNVEPGYTTTEFWLTLGSQMATVTIGLFVAFGVPVTPDQKVAVLTAVPVLVSFLGVVYMLGRSWRKNVADTAASNQAIASVAKMSESSAG